MFNRCKHLRQSFAFLGAARSMLCNLNLSVFKSILLLLAVLVLSPRIHAQAAPGLCAELFDSSQSISLSTRNGLSGLVAAEKSARVPDIHQTKVYLVEKNQNFVKTPISVVIYHGLYNSPAWMEWIAESVQRMGINVINVRLPRHFTGERQDLDRMNYQEILDLTAQITPLAEGLSQSGKIVYIGHSTGALASIFSSMKQKSSTAGMVLFAPALGIHGKMKRLAYALSSVGVSGGLLDAIAKLRAAPHDPMKRYESSYAGVQVHRMGNHLKSVGAEANDKPFAAAVAHLSELPVLWVDTALDKTIDLSLNQNISAQLPTVDRYQFHEDLNVAHNNTFDPPTYKDSPDLLNARNEVTDKWRAFLQKFLDTPQD
jgi:alpha-beta hydrolase superfamily lysophospholipase